MAPTNNLKRRQLTFKVKVVALIAGIVALLIAVPTGQSWLIKQESINIWMGHMLAGTGGSHTALDRDRWQVSDHATMSTWLGAWPFLGETSLQNRQIFVADRTGIGGSGWVVSGGPVDSIEVAGTRYELYGRAIDRYDPGFFGGFHNQTKTVYDFFLLRRNAKSGTGIIVKSWVGFKQSAISATPVGTIGYDSNTRMIHIMINAQHTVIASDTLMQH